MSSWQRSACGWLCLLLVALCSGLWPVHAAPGSTFVFFEKFSPTNPNQWHVQTLHDGSRTYLTAGSYQIIRSRPGTMRGWPLGVKVPIGFQFNAQLQFIAGKDPYEGVSFWDDLKNSFTLFALTPDGKAGLFRHTAKGYQVLINWRTVGQVHRGLGARNSLSVNLDPVSALTGRTFLINGVPLGKRCRDVWRPAIGKMPIAPKQGLFVGVLAGAYTGATHVAVLRASMYDGSHAGPVPHC